MALKKDLNFEEKLTFYLENDMRNLVNSGKQPEQWKSLKMFTLMGYFCGKYVMFELKRYRGVVL